MLMMKTSHTFYTTDSRQCLTESRQVFIQRIADKHIFMVDVSHRAQRSEVRAERLVFLAKDNRHNLLGTCVTRVTYIFTAGQITVGS